MPIEKRSDGWYVVRGNKSEGPFTSRAKAREANQPCTCENHFHEQDCKLPSPSPELAWESIPGMLTSGQDVKAKNSRTGRTVKLTFKQAPGQIIGFGRLFVDGRKQKGLNVGILTFKQAAERIGADLLEGMARK